MTRKIALKRLTRSDLTLFEWHFRNSNAGNQKAINLNADVFVQEMFPLLPEEASRRDGKFPVDLFIFGPGPAPGWNLQRKVTKQSTYKNWRLNGEFIANPPDQPDRFNALRENDFALIEFQGVHYPDAARMVLIGADTDTVLHRECERFLGVRRMATMSLAELDSLLTTSGATESFPIAGASIEAAMENVAFGDPIATARLLRRGASRRVSKEELRTARETADRTGAMGEELVADYLAREVAQGRLANFTWDSMDNAIAPFDFTLQLPDGKQLRCDVKSTRGEFTNRVHVSANELLHMRDAPEEYRLYRVYQLTEAGGALRVSEPMRDFSRDVLSVIDKLPFHVSADGVSVDPTSLRFSSEIRLLPDQSTDG
jgi:hypothetical protein